MAEYIISRCIITPYIQSTVTDCIQIVQFCRLVHFLEHVGDFMIERERGNFILDKADFAEIAGSYLEKIQRSLK
ncbi:MAG: hypothetical protein ACKV1O_03240 [Saprospiraceae bacterium]